ncbi:Uncharacterised protein [Mycobacterium tuberculosis]|nr:Uncharacterised protein [Mycobacterium tuberculosis]
MRLQDLTARVRDLDVAPRGTVEQSGLRHVSERPVHPVVHGPLPTAGQHLRPLVVGQTELVGHRRDDVLGRLRLSIGKIRENRPHQRLGIRDRHGEPLSSWLVSPPNRPSWVSPSGAPCSDRPAAGVASSSSAPRVPGPADLKGRHIPAMPGRVRRVRHKGTCTSRTGSPAAATRRRPVPHRMRCRARRQTLPIGLASSGRRQHRPGLTVRGSAGIRPAAAQPPRSS